MRRHKLRYSTSAKRRCYDGPCAENCFHSIKIEVLHGERFETNDTMRRRVFKYIRLTNRQRRH
ncbi:IS3 family transposase [Halomonas sp. V046]|uniref:IS3 family transposase n=1 Tax=Halomonas sp. V046 TaxID=3459611 RepID=UPI0040439C9F